MSNTTETCNYVLNPDDPSTWNKEDGDSCYINGELLNGDGVWTCPHETQPGEDLCIFHSPVEEKDDEYVKERLIEVLEEDDKNEHEFIGAKFGSLNISDTQINSSVPKIFFTDSSFGSISITDSEIFSSVDFSGTEFRGESYFNGTVFHKNIRFDGIKTETIHFAEVRFESEVSFNDSTLGLVYFSEAYFAQGTRFHSVTFSNGISLERTTFAGVCSFYKTKVVRTADFSNAEFRDELSFWKVNFDGEIDFGNSEFFGEVFFREVDLDEVERIIFVRAIFHKTPNFTSTNLNGADFRLADLTDADFTDATLSESNFESALLSRATLFDADLRGAALNGAVLGDVRINEQTQFLGHPEDENNHSPHTFAAIRAKPCCVYDPNYKGVDADTNVNKAKSVYRALEELASKAARTRLQSRCFVRRQDLQKNSYKTDITHVKSWQERLIAGARYTRAKVARTTLLYGESPWRIIAGSISTIFLIGLLYPVGEWLRPVSDDPITYSRILNGEWDLLLESFYFSTLTFTTLGMGDYEPLGFGQVLATLNTSFGAVLIALLVFVLGRRAAR